MGNTACSFSFTYSPFVNAHGFAARNVLTGRLRSRYVSGKLNENAIYAASRTGASFARERGKSVKV